MNIQGKSFQPATTAMFVELSPERVRRNGRERERDDKIKSLAC